ncbi:TetR/AcrR family transcriptional regulator [Streptomyces sp. NPDC020412]|uniref:TetR/AcrR family transcriptional regulator n=1 Tax=Streptomyces sp. NPDC020412 TaxID=3365073 RepID=UPI00378D38FA
MGRPRTPLIDRERIATAALELVDEQGDFTLAQVAGRLGVQTASLYHHVDGRDGIVELLRERVCAAIDADALAAPAWDDALAGWARSYRAAFAAHPRAIPLLMAAPVRAPRVLEHYERAVRVLLDAGFAVGDVMKVIIALENLILGSALDLAAPEPMWVLPDESATPWLARALSGPAGARANTAFELALTGCLSHVASLRVASPGGNV